MREYTTRSDDCTNTITTVQKDNYVLCIGAAMRGRYCNKKRNKKSNWIIRNIPIHWPQYKRIV